jgi:hypothetical protein
VLRGWQAGVWTHCQQVHEQRLWYIGVPAGPICQTDCYKSALLPSGQLLCDRSLLVLGPAPAHAGPQDTAGVGCCSQ